MRPLALAVILLSSGACFRQKYTPMGEADTDVSGTYTTQVSERSNTCSIRPVFDQRAQTEVYASPPSASFRLIFGGLPFDGTLRRGGAFSTQFVITQASGAREEMGISGRFTATGFSARATVDRSTGNGRCTYVLVLQGVRR